jgi:glutathione S-transferase
MTAQGELMLTNQAKGPFVLGEKPSYTDFFLAGNLQSARVIDEGVFQRLIRYPGYGEIYNACEPYMEKKD